MKDKKLVILLGAAAILLIIVIAVCSVFLLKGNSKADMSYLQYIELGDKYLDEEDYEKAIAAYRSAISAEPDNEDAYYSLATLYKDMNKINEAKSVLRSGIDRTNSDMLKKLYHTLFNERYPSDTAEGEKLSTIEFNLNRSMCQVFANYTYSDYLSKYSVSQKTSSEVLSYYCSTLKSTLYFYDDDDDKKSIDADHETPYDKVRPNYIIMDDLTDLIVGISSGKKIGQKDLKGIGATDIHFDHNTSTGRFVSFEYDHCIIEVVVDENEEFSTDSQHKIYSAFGTGSEEEEDEKFDGKIMIISATTGNAVREVSVEVRKDGMTSGATEWEGESDSNGYCNMSLKSGTYTATVECEGYISEEFEFEVFTSGQYNTESWTISPELGAGEIRIVLEWGSTPCDLDSYYYDESGTEQVSYDDRDYYDGDNLIASLDVDDTNGFGPETLTVYDSSRPFTYKVKDFTNSGVLGSLTDVTVKVYLPDGTNQVYTPNYMEDDDTWVVFSYSNGMITEGN